MKADYDQIVVVGQNRGRVLEDVNNPSLVMLMRLKDYMEQHGYRVTKRR